MRSMSKSAAAALLMLLTFCLPLSAFSDWNMTRPLKSLLSKRSAQAEEKKNDAPSRPARFKDNGDGTVTDRRTGLIWLKDASCAVFSAEDRSGSRNSRSWHEARVAASRLADGFCGLKDDSKAGEWRLPTREELLDIAKKIDSRETWEAGEALSGLQSFYYWSSSLGDLYPDYAFYVSLGLGIDSYAFQLNSFHVLPVRRPKAKPQQPQDASSPKNIEEANAVRGLQNAAEEPVQ